MFVIHLKPFPDPESGTMFCLFSQTAESFPESIIQQKGHRSQPLAHNDSNVSFQSKVMQQKPKILQPL